MSAFTDSIASFVTELDIAHRIHANSRDYGAVGDGITDDTAALQTFFDEAYASDILAVLRAGTYLLSANITIKRPFVSTGSVTFKANHTADSVSPVSLVVERRMGLSFLTFDCVNLVYVPAGNHPVFIPALISNNLFINAILIAGRDDVIAQGLEIVGNNIAWGKSRSKAGIKIININNVSIERNEIQECSTGVLIEPTRSYAASNISIRHNKISNCPVSIDLRGKSMFRVAKPIVEGNTLVGTGRDAASSLRGDLLALWCCDPVIKHNTITGNSDNIKMQACLGGLVENNTLTNGGGQVNIRVSGCVDVIVRLNRMFSTSYNVLFLPAGVNSIVNGNNYPCTGNAIEDNTLHCKMHSVKVVSGDQIRVRRNAFHAESAINPSAGLLWFTSDVTRSTHYDNVYYAPSGTALKNEAGSEVVSTIGATTNIVTTTAGPSVAPPIITQADSALNFVTSYVVTFTVGNAAQIKQLANDDALMSMTDWMASATNPTLGWNTSAWRISSHGNLPDVTINGIAHDNYGVEDFWWARSSLVIDRFNRLTCRDFASSYVSANIPLGLGAAAAQEYTWQSASFRPPLIVDGAAYNPALTGLVNENEFLHSVSGRTVLGQRADGTYVLLVTDGKTGVKGATLPQTQAKLLELGCVQAYSLDGGGSTTLWYGGAVINRPSDTGGERNIPAVMYV